MGEPYECIGGEFLMADYLVTDTELTSVADAIRTKGGTTEQLSFPAGFVSAVESIQAGASEPILQEKTATPATSQQEITPDNGYDGLSKVTVAAMPTATQATPSITVSTAGKITASASQSAGYVAAGTKSATKQLTTQAAKTVTPGRANQTAVASGRYTTGAVTVKGDANLVAGNIKSGVSIFGVAGTLEAGSSKSLPFTSINESNIVSIDSSGYAVITVPLSVVNDFPNLIYLEGTADNGETVHVVRVGDGDFYGSVYGSDVQGFYDADVFIYETTNADGSKSFEWMVDPDVIEAISRIAIETIVMGA